MTYSDDLFMLIKSLTKSEKRHFKLFVTKTVSLDEKNYLRLYNEIIRQKSYDEKQLQLKFKGENLSKNFSATKYQLYHIILKSLVLLYSSRSHYSKERLTLNQAQILFERSLYKQSIKKIEAAKKVAMDNEDVNSMHDVLELERKLYPYRENSNMNDVIKSEKYTTNWILQELAITSCFQEILALMKIYHRVKNKEELKRIEELINQPMLIEFTALKSANSKILYYRILSIYFFLIGDNYLAFKYTKSATSILSGKNNKDRLYQHHLSESLFYSIIFGFEADINSDLTADISIFFKLKGINPNEKFTSDLYKKYILASSFLYEGKTAICESSINELENSIMYSAGKIDPYFVILSLNLVCCYLFLTRKYEKLIMILDFLIFKTSKLIGLAIKDFMMLLRVIVHYEMRNYDYAENLIRNTSRFLKKKNRYSDLEKLILATIKSLLNINHPKKKHQKFFNLNACVNHLRNTDQLFLGKLESKVLFTWISDNMKGK